MLCNINNGAEMLNEDLRNDKLVEYKNCTLSELLEVLIENFIPKHYEKYRELNVKYNSGGRKYQKAMKNEDTVWQIQLK